MGNERQVNDMFNSVPVTQAEQIMGLMQDGEPRDVDEIAKCTGLNRGSVSARTSELRKNGNLLVINTSKRHIYQYAKSLQEKPLPPNSRRNSRRARSPAYIERAFMILSALARAQDGKTYTQLAKATGLKYGSVKDTAPDLVRDGWIHLTKAGLYKVCHISADGLKQFQSWSTHRSIRLPVQQPMPISNGMLELMTRMNTEQMILPRYQTVVGESLLNVAIDAEQLEKENASLRAQLADMEQIMEERDRLRVRYTTLCAKLTNLQREAWFQR